MSNTDDFLRVTNAYKAAVDLLKLSSDQVHSRLNAMLTANSIIVMVSGLAVASQVQIPRDMIMVLIAGGLTLCLVWGFFVFQGVKVENYYRCKLEKFEEMAIPAGKQLLVRNSNWIFWGFGIATYFTIGVFVAIYAILLLVLLTR